MLGRSAAHRLPGVSNGHVWEGDFAGGFVALCFLWVKPSGSHLEGLPQSVHRAWGTSPFGGPVDATDLGQHRMVWLTALLLCSAHQQTGEG